MKFVKRILLFFAINALVVVTISLLLNFLGVKPFLTSHGVSYKDLMIFCIIWGFGGAFISLGLSRILAKWMMGVKVIDAGTSDEQLKAVVDVVHSLARKGGLETMPQVGVYESPEVNAFATGPSRNRALVAVSRGALNRMSSEELEGVLAHEMAHIFNGDMVTMTLMQGVINAFVMFLARALALAFSGLGSQNNRQRSSSGSYMTYNILVVVFEVVFMVLGMVVIASFSRRREFRADLGGARFVGKEKMIKTLEALQKTVKIQDVRMEKAAFQSMKISNASRQGLMRFFMTHPPLEARIERLKHSATL